MKKLFTAGIVAGAFAATISGALAGPLLLGPTTAPMLPKVMAVPVSTVPVQSKLLNTYRQIRAFWLSRAIVR